MEIIHKKGRTLTSVGSNCVTCTLDCGSFDVFNPDHEAFSTALKINGVVKSVTLCGHHLSPKRNSDKFLRRDDSICDNCRICLMKQPDFDPNSKVEKP